MHSSTRLAGSLALAALLALPFGSSVRAAKDKTTETGSGAAVGQKAPDFSLKDTEGNTHTLHEYLQAGKTVVVHWFNPKCPFIVRHFETYPTFTTLYSNFHDKNVVFLAINSTGPSNPAFGTDAESKKKWSIPYPILLDPTGTVGKSYGAKTTPHSFVISSDGELLKGGRRCLASHALKGAGASALERQVQMCAKTAVFP